jgi:pimeloyl-ACP methyl ester carboxylesterase
MPHLNISTSTGAVNLSYTISTPSDPSAKYIDEHLPTVIFLHPVFIGQEIFHSAHLTPSVLLVQTLSHDTIIEQFRDPRLRRFNCISVDSRCHGHTTGRVGKDYDRVEAARDIVKFMASSCLVAGWFAG